MLPRLWRTGLLLRGKRVLSFIDQNRQPWELLMRGRCSSYILKEWTFRVIQTTC